MPQSALKAGVVTLVLSPRAIHNLVLKLHDGVTLDVLGSGIGDESP
jgi:hypothetical protein